MAAETDHGKWKYRLTPGDLEFKPIKLDVATQPGVRFTKMKLKFLFSNPHPSLSAIIYDTPHLFVEGPSLQVTGVRRLSSGERPLGTRYNPEQKAAIAYVMKEDPMRAEFAPGAQGIIEMDLFKLYPWLARLPCRSEGYKMRITFCLRNPFIGGMNCEDSPSPTISLDGVKLSGKVSDVPIPMDANGFLRPLYYFDDITVLAGESAIPYAPDMDCDKILIQVLDRKYENIDFEVDWLGHGDGISREVVEPIVSQVYRPAEGATFPEGRHFMIRAVAEIRYVKLTLFLSERVTI